MNSENNKELNRRSFIASTSATAAGIALTSQAGQTGLAATASEQATTLPIINKLTFANDDSLFHGHPNSTPNTIRRSIRGCSTGINGS